MAGYFDSYFGSYFDVATGSVAEGVAEASGLATVQAEWAWTGEGIAEAQALATPESVGEAIAEAQGQADGGSTAEATAEAFGTLEAVAEASGTSEAIAYADAPEVVTETFSGGHGWANLASLERRRRKREIEEEADRLEVALIAEQLLPPNPVVESRHTVREYVRSNPPPSRKVERAVEYAYRTRSDLAWQLAAREIAKQEEDDFALLLALAAVA